MVGGEREGSKPDSETGEQRIDRPDKSERRMDNSSKTVIETYGYY